QALTDLATAHDQIIELNRNLELRVAQRTSALEAANRELEAFSCSVSHDLLGPARSIAVLAQSIVTDTVDGLGGVARDRIDRILASARQMDRLIEALLEFARMG